MIQKLKKRIACTLHMFFYEKTLINDNLTDVIQKITYLFILKPRNKYFTIIIENTFIFINSLAVINILFSLFMISDVLLVIFF